MKFAVTGGAGFVGSHIVKKLISDGHKVIVIDNLKTGKKENLGKHADDVEFIQGDIRNYDLLKDSFRNVNGVFHQAALASVPDSFRIPDEYHDVNVNGTENIFKLAAQDGFKVVYASSSSVYGNPVKIPIYEDHPKKPINPYAKTKLDDEGLAQKYASQGAKIIGLRYFNIFGEGQSRDYAGVIKKFLENIYNNMPPIVNGNGLQTRDFVYVEDVVRANLLAMESSVKHAFINIGTNSSITILELAEQIIKISGLSLKIVHGPVLEGDIEQSVADISLAKKLLNWEPKTTLNDWLKIAIPAKLN
ncbi:MAG: NAD-dependent epimerase/dehydratase family protein [Thaumarchaeota archaeon]|nr:NAD-dependent epimerase/dehydratase family protein [Nitrososphaerota archaeon]